MNYYIVNQNAQPTGEHEVHVNTCGYRPLQENSTSLGYFNTCREALIEARKYFNNVDGCAYCCSNCHRK